MARTLAEERMQRWEKLKSANADTISPNSHPEGFILKMKKKI